MMGHIFISTTITDTKKKMSILQMNHFPPPNSRHESRVSSESLPHHVTVNIIIFSIFRLQDLYYGLETMVVPLSAYLLLLLA